MTTPRSDRARAERIAALAQMRQNTTHDAYAPNGITAQQAAWRLGVSPRTIQRYRRALREATR